MAVSVSVPPTVTIAASGTQGVVGADGPTGADGAQGPAGADGPTGDTGPQGPTGDTGPTGPRGPTGPSGGGGSGGGAPIPYDDPVGAGIIVLTPTSDWTQVIGANGTHVRRIVPAATADLMMWSASFMRTGTVYDLTARILKGDGSVSRYVCSSGPVANTQGYAPWYGQSTSFPGVTGSRFFTVQADEIDADGNWAIEMVYRGSGITGSDSRLYFGDSYDGYWTVAKWPAG